MVNTEKHGKVTASGINANILTCEKKIGFYNDMLATIKARRASKNYPKTQKDADIAYVESTLADWESNLVIWQGHSV